MWATQGVAKVADLYSEHSVLMSFEKLKSKHLTRATLHHFNPNIPDNPNVCNNVGVCLVMLYFNTQ